MCPYQRVKNVCFGGNLVGFVFLKPPFLRFSLLPFYRRLKLSFTTNMFLCTFKTSSRNYMPFFSVGSEVEIVLLQCCYRASKLQKDWQCYFNPFYWKGKTLELSQLKPCFVVNILEIKKESMKNYNTRKLNHLTIFQRAFLENVK